jgi:predicted phage tail protein
VRSVITPPSGGGAACGPTSELRVVSQTCTSPTIAVPGAPSRVKSIVSGSTVTLYWSRPTSGGPADGYQISVGTSSGASDIINRRDVGAVTSATGTLANGQYYARVYAYNSAGVGPASSDIWFKVGARRRPGSPSGITASFQNSTVVLGWAPPAGDPEDAPTGYAIEVGSAPGRYDLAAIPTRDVTSFQAVAPPGIYFVRVRAANDLGGGGASQEIVVRAGSGPGAPTSLSALRQGALVELRWQAPSTGATLPGSYIVEVGTAPGLADRAVLRVANETRFATVAPAGVYYVRVRAVGADGVAGESSNEIVVTQ